MPSLLRILPSSLIVLFVHSLSSFAPFYFVDCFMLTYTVLLLRFTFLLLYVLVRHIISGLFIRPSSRAVSYLLLFCCNCSKSIDSIYSTPSSALLLALICLPARSFALLVGVLIILVDFSSLYNAIVCGPLFGLLRYICTSRRILG